MSKKEHVWKQTYFSGEALLSLRLLSASNNVFYSSWPADSSGF